MTTTKSRCIEYKLTELNAVATEIVDLLRTTPLSLWVGDLGAGKTTLIKECCRILGVEETISSPTFSLINEYKSNQPIYHIDLYRIETAQEAMDLGIEDYIYSGHICFIEWPQIIESLLPDELVICKLENLDNFTRKLEINHHL